MSLVTIQRCGLEGFRSPEALVSLQEVGGLNLAVVLGFRVLGAGSGAAECCFLYVLYRNPLTGSPFFGSFQISGCRTHAQPYRGLETQWLTARLLNLVSSFKATNPKPQTLTVQNPEPKAQLGGSWVVRSREISRITILITHIRGLLPQP